LKVLTSNYPKFLPVLFGKKSLFRFFGTWMWSPRSAGHKLYWWLNSKRSWPLSEICSADVLGLAASLINVKLREMMSSGRYGTDMRVTMGIIDVIDCMFICVCLRAIVRARYIWDNHMWQFTTGSPRYAHECE
jgi:hypothetical protein